MYYLIFLLKFYRDLNARLRAILCSGVWRPAKSAEQTTQDSRQHHERRP